MVECPVCGKWLKHPFALGGHMRLKGDYAQSIHFEKYKADNANQGSTDLEKQVKELISTIKQQMENTKKDSTDADKQVWDLINLLKKQNENLSSLMHKIPGSLELFSNIYDKLAQSIKQIEIKLDKLEIKAEKPIIKEEKTRTVAEITKEYGTFDNAVKVVDHRILTDIINNDKDLNLSKRLELKEKVRNEWLEH